jgi:hypothetical protein
MSSFNSPIFDDLDKSFKSRIDISKQARTADEAEATAKAQERLPEGSLGRIDTALDPEFLQAAQSRTQFSENLNLDEPIGLQRRNIETTDSAYEDLIKQRTSSSPESQAARENAIINLQRATQGRLKQGRQDAAAGGFISGGTQAAQSQEALRNEMLARGNLERDILLANQEARERLTRDRENARATNIGQLGNLMISETSLIDNAKARTEAVTEAVQDARLERELYNLESLRSEMFGQLALEESAVQMGVAERGGIRQELIAERGQAESERHAREMEEIQRIEAEKEPPSGGGGKSVMCVVMWEMGLIDDKILKADFEYCRRNIDDDTRRGYFWLTTPLASACLKGGQNGILTKIFAPMTVAWAKEMAFRMGESSEGSFLGRAMCSLGVPLCRLIGQGLKFLGMERIGNDEATEILSRVAHLDPEAVDLLPRDEKLVLMKQIKISYGEV